MSCILSKSKFFICLFLTLLFISRLSAESFRVHATKSVELNESGTPEKIEAGINDAVVIILPEDLSLIQGIELSFKVPETVAEWTDSVAWCFYDEVKPEPSVKTIDYSGIRGNLRTFNANTLNIQVPLSEEAKGTIKKSAYASLLDKVPQNINGKLFLRLQLAMKGVPEDIDKKKFVITVRPIFIDKGKLNVIPEPPEETELKPYTTFIDGNTVENDETGYILEPGTHTVTVVSDFYRNETRTVTVEQGQKLALTVKLRDIAPAVQINSPASAEVYLDNEKIENIHEYITISQGEHEIRFVVGDYETVRTLNAVNGRNYTVSLTLEADISEEE